ncbi:steroid binding [Coemansia erecta]|uniref:Steroid binding n=1 Tax=Coemansia erecta TaxID=147472 RepID=A0A9W8CMS8_9FUNG|nr:steroid binding [Coemansia erecta]
MSKTFTLKELRQYDGRQTTGDATILLGFNGKVYDVTAGAGFYGPGKSYSVFAGRDSTLALARGSLEQSLLPEDDGEPVDSSALTDAEREAVATWEQRLAAKYAQRGVLGRQ